MQKPSFFDKIKVQSKNLFIANEELEMFEKFTKLLAIGVFTDGEISKVELEKSKQIIDKEIDEFEQSYIYTKLLLKLEEYEQASWLYQKDQNNMINYIMKEKNWHYANFLSMIIKTNKQVSNEGQDILESLKPLLERRSHNKQMLKKKRRFDD